MTNNADVNVDVLVVGGGAAGLTAALMLGRSRRTVLVLDAGEPRNAPADGVHGYLGREGVAPDELVRIGRAEVEAYGVRVRAGRAVAAAREGTWFDVALDDFTMVRARRIVLATGVVDELPDVPGLRERWGRDVVHCPYCHGWEVRDQRIVVLATGPMAAHQASLFRQLTDDMTVLLHDQPPFSPETAEELAARDIRVVTGEVDRLLVDDDRLTGVRLRSGEVVAADAVAVGSRPMARPDLLADLGLDVVDMPGGMGSQVEADMTGRTAVAGVWATGNLTDPYAQVLPSAAAGSRTGAMVNADLVAEETRDAVARRRSPVAAQA